MSESPSPNNLTPGAQRLVDAVKQKHDPPSIEEWLLTLMERHGPMAESLCADIKADDLLGHLPNIIKQGQMSEWFETDAFVTLAVARAEERGKELASERDLAAVILISAGYELLPDSVPSAPRPLQAKSGSAEPNSTTGATESSAGTRAKRPTPTLDRLGVDLTRAARDGKYPSLIGRDQEVRIVIETLCRHSKRNPVLVGPAGVGKTAIVEGLATRIAVGNVPEILRGTRIVSLQRSALLGGAQSSGDVAGRLQTILKEAAQDGIVLFIDELHSFMDFADDLKPALARGDVACIGATTDDEYRQIVENDRALERRFQPLRIQAPSAEQTLLILESLRGTLATGRGIDIETEILEHLVALAERYLRNRHFPDKAVDLLEQCIAYALTEGKSSVSREDADTVVQRLIGMPLSSDEQLKTFQAQITDRGILSQFDASALCARLAVTLNGFDLRPERPNATVLFPGDATHNAEALAREAAAALYGGEDRIVVIDFGPMRQEHDVSILIGSPPGYVGYSRPLPLHHLAQMPWCVLVCTNVEYCHPSIRALLARGLATGKITDAAGKQIYLSDALVILTMESKIVEKAKMGFTHPSDRDREADSGSQTPEEVRKMAAKVIGEDLADDCDVICTASAAPETALGGEKLMANLRDLCLREKLHLDWEPSVVSWMKSQASRCHSEHDWERLLDDRLIPLLTPYRAHRSADPMRLMITADDGALQVNPQPLSASWAEPDAEQASSRP